MFVQLATTAQRAAVYPLHAQLALIKTKLEGKVKMTVNHVPLVNKKLYFKHLWVYTNPLVFIECLYQAGSSSYLAKDSAIPVLLASTASHWFPVLCPAQQAMSVLGGVCMVNLFPAPEAPITQVRVSPPQVFFLQ